MFISAASKFSKQFQSKIFLLQIRQIRKYPLKLRPPLTASEQRSLPSRAPVVTIMGHIDHGKTSLLDAFRNSNVVKSEHGGITQHIGAFSVKLKSGSQITFIDTPGHQVFTSMRARGAQITDIVVLVVAADDGVLPTTVEAIKHALAAQVPLVVAINKIDIPGLNLNKQKEMIFRQLMENGVTVEDYGGDVQVAEISARKQIGLDKLEECLMTLSEIMELKSDKSGMFEGVVLESRQVKGKGNVSTILVQRGTLKVGSFVVFSNGKSWVKIRAMFDDQNKSIKQAFPSMPVEIVGAWSGVANAGEQGIQVEDENYAKGCHEEYLQIQKDIKLAQEAQLTGSKVDKNSYEEKLKLFEKKVAQAQKLKNTNAKPQYFEVMRQIRHLRQELEQLKTQDIVVEDPSSQTENSKQAVIKDLNLVIKGDVFGSIEAVSYSLQKLRGQILKRSKEDVNIKILHSGTGNITQSDIELLAAIKKTSGESAECALISFNLPEQKNLRQLIQSYKIPVISHNIIYKLIDDVQALIGGMLTPDYAYQVVGEAQVLATFKIGKEKDLIAGCRVNQGTLYRNLQSLERSDSSSNAQNQKIKYRVIRNDIKIYEGNLRSLKHHKNDVRQVTSGMECGILLDENFAGPQVGDIIQCVQEDKIAFKLNFDDQI